MPQIRAATRRAWFWCRGGDHFNRFDDGSIARRFHLLLIASLGWLGVAALLAIPLFAIRKAALEVLLLILGGTAATALILLRRGHRQRAAALYLSVLWCIAGGASLLNGGVRGVALYLAFAVSLTAAWLLGRSAAIGFGAAILTLSLVEAVLEHTGHPLPVYFPGTPIAIWVIQTGIAALNVGPVLVFLDDLRTKVAAHRDSEDRFRNLSDASFEGIMIHNGTVILDCNLALARLFGCEKPEELIGTDSSTGLLTPESLERVRRRMARAESGIVEITGIRRDGALFPAEIESRPVKYSGQDARIVAWRDLTDRKRSEEALRESEVRFRTLVENAPVSIAFSRKLRFLYANRAFHDLYGMSDEIEGKPITDCVAPESRPEFADRARKREMGLPVATDYESTAVRTDGSRFDVAASVERINLGDGPATVGFFRDISQEKRTLMALRESEERFRSAFDFSPIGMALVNNDGRWLKVNEALCGMLGYTEPALLERHFPDITHPDDLQTSVNLSAEMLSGERSHFQVEKRFIHRSGETVWVDLFAAGVRGPTGEPLYSISLMHDITGRKHSEAEGARLKEQLAQAAKLESIGRLAGGVAHDFNNMLTVILGYAAMTKEKLPPHAPELRYLTEIEKAGTRSKEITQQLLGFSRRQIIAPVLTNLNKLVRDLEEPLARLIGEDIELAFRPGKGLHRVVVDHSQINQILLNLVVNARDAMPNGGKVTIETENQPVSEAYCHTHPEATAGPHVVLAVSDTGTGIEAGILEHIFEPFFTTKEMTLGTGLGLATVYGVVKQNGGFITVHSSVQTSVYGSVVGEPGFGTTFRIYFPQMAGDAPVDEEVDPADSRQAGSGTILLVEDDELVRGMTTEALRALGYTPLVASSPGMAIDILTGPEGKDIALMLTDVVMPGMTGTTLRDRVLALKPHIKVLFMSGYTANVIVNHGVLKPGVEFIQKPFTITELGRRIEEVRLN